MNSHVINCQKEVHCHIWLFLFVFIGRPIANTFRVVTIFPSQHVEHVCNEVKQDKVRVDRANNTLYNEQDGKSTQAIKQEPKTHVG